MHDPADDAHAAGRSVEPAGRTPISSFEVRAARAEAGRSDPDRFLRGRRVRPERLFNVPVFSSLWTSQLLLESAECFARLACMVYLMERNGSLYHPGGSHPGTL